MRTIGVSLAWLMAYIKVKYAAVPDDLGFKFKPETTHCGDKIYIKLIDCQADELWSFVFRRKNVKYIWIALHTQTRQIIALYIGDRSRESAKKLWEKIPTKLREICYFHTHNWESYKTVIPEDRHEYSKIKKYTNHLERFNNTLRQRCSRLVRETLSFSNGATIRKLENHIGAINFF